MPNLPTVFRPHRHAGAERQPERKHDAKRRQEKPWRRWYKLAIWLKLRAAQLTAHPLCRRCLERGNTVAATVVNHVAPHRGVWALFSDPTNLESLCKACHDAAVQFEETHGYSGDVGLTGKYLDPRHPSNAGRGKGG